MRMSEDEINQFLSEPRIATLATNGADGYPNLTATWYLYEDQKVFLFCGRSTPRIDYLFQDNKVALLIDDDHFPYKFAALYGTAQIDESNTDEYLNKIAAKYLGPEWGHKYAASLKRSIDPVIVEITVAKKGSWNYYTGGYRTKAPKPLV